MFPFLSAEIQQELDQLAQQYGQPLIRTVNIGPRANFDPLNKRDRYGEVCMVIRRKNGRLLTMIKTYYPRGAYRLLTGGINIGEPVFEALLRETNEETGLEVKVDRFLAAIAYTSAETGETPAFYTFAFLLDEVGGTFGVIDEDEKVEEFPREFYQPISLRWLNICSISTQTSVLSSVATGVTGATSALLSTAWSGKPCRPDLP